METKSSNYKKTILFISSMVMCITLSFSIETLGKQDSLGRSNERRLALLIGIDSYRNVRKLYGCVNDIELMKYFLSKRGFSESDIVLLRNSNATKSAIVKAFNDLIEKAKSDDVVLVHFSGHGSQVRDDSKEEIDGLDETLVPYDYINNSANARASSLTDDEINRLVTRLSAKTSKLTLVLDACHSGGGTKNLSLDIGSSVLNERYIPPVDIPDIDKSKAKAYDELDRDLSGYGDSKSGYVLITGCRSDESSRETLLGGKQHGILSYSLINELLATDGPQLWPDVMDNVKYQVRKRNYFQTPQLAGDYSNSYVFGDRAYVNRKFILASPGANGMVDIDAGEILGITIGSTFVVYPPGTNDFESSGSIAEIEIMQTFAETSRARIISGTIEAVNSKAIETAHSYPNSRLRVAFTGQWKSDLSRTLKSDILKLEGVIEDDTDPQLRFEFGQDLIFRFPNSNNLLNIFTVTSKTFSVDVMNQVKLWRKWFHVLQISNSKAKLKLAVDLNVVTTKRGLGFVPSPEYVFIDEEEVELKIFNKSKKQVFVSILNLRDDGSIMPYTLGDFLGQAANDAIKSNDSVVVRFPVIGRTGKEETIDIIKLFATESDINFEYLKQGDKSHIDNKLQDLVGREIRPPRTTVGTDDWTTIEKVVLIKGKK